MKYLSREQSLLQADNSKLLMHANMHYRPNMSMHSIQNYFNLNMQILTENIKQLNSTGYWQHKQFILLTTYTAFQKQALPTETEA